MSAEELIFNFTAGMGFDCCTVQSIVLSKEGFERFAATFGDRLQYLAHSNINGEVRAFKFNTATGPVDIVKGA